MIKLVAERYAPSTHSLGSLGLFGRRDGFERDAGFAIGRHLAEVADDVLGQDVGAAAALDPGADRHDDHAAADLGVDMGLDLELADRRADDDYMLVFDAELPGGFGADPDRRHFG